MGCRMEYGLTKLAVGLLVVLACVLGVGASAAVGYVQHQDQRISNIENYLAAVSAAGR